MTEIEASKSALGSAGPLEGLRIIEVGSFIAGPFCGQLLGDLGAEVIKIEPPGVGDAMRNWGTVKNRNHQSMWWSVIGRNKRSVTVDLRKAEGQDILRALTRDADALIENFRPGTLESWGIGPESLQAENRDLIVARISGFGQTGPDSHKAGFAAVAEARAGLRHLTGYPDRPSTRVGISIGDSLAGMNAAIGILAALLARKAGKGGQVIDVAIAESVLGVMESVVAEYGEAQQVRGRTGPILPRIAPSNIYPTQDGSYVLIAANGDGLFRRLAQLMGQPELSTDIRYSTHDARGDNQAELDELVKAWTSSHTLYDLLEMLEAAGVPAGSVNTAAEVANDPHFRARSAIVEVADPTSGSVVMQGVFPRLTRTPGSIRWTGQQLGEETDTVLKELLGKSSADIDCLRADGVI